MYAHLSVNTVWLFQSFYTSWKFTGVVPLELKWIVSKMHRIKICLSQLIPTFPCSNICTAVIPTYLFTFTTKLASTTLLMSFHIFHYSYSKRSQNKNNLNSKHYKMAKNSFKSQQSLESLPLLWQGSSRSLMSLSTSSNSALALRQCWFLLGYLQAIQLKYSFQCYYSIKLSLNFELIPTHASFSAQILL